MLIKSSKDWKQYLGPEDEEKLNRLLKEVARHRPAFRNADDVKVAQLWSALLELRKENEYLRSRLNEMEDVFQAIYERMKRRREEKNQLIQSLDKL